MDTCSFTSYHRHLSVVLLLRVLMWKLIHNTEGTNLYLNPSDGLLSHNACPSRTPLRNNPGSASCSEEGRSIALWYYEKRCISFPSTFVIFFFYYWSLWNQSTCSMYILFTMCQLNESSYANFHKLQKLKIIHSKTEWNIAWNGILYSFVSFHFYHWIFITKYNTNTLLYDITIMSLLLGPNMHIYNNMKYDSKVLYPSEGEIPMLYMPCT